LNILPRAICETKDCEPTAPQIFPAFVFVVFINGRNYFAGEKSQSLHPMRRAETVIMINDEIKGKGTHPS